MGNIIRKSFPWLIAAALLGWLLSQYPAEQLLISVRLADYRMLFPLSIGYFLIIWCIDCIGTSLLLRRFVAPISWRQLLPIRAATYLLSLINYGAGQAAFAIALKKSHQLATGDTIASFLLLTATDLFWVVTLAFVGTFFGAHAVLGVNLIPWVQVVAAALYAAIGGHLLFWGLRCDRRVTGQRWDRCIAWLARHHLIRIFQTATLRDYARLALVRLPIHLMLVLVLALVIVSFHGHVPLLAVLGNVPIAILIGTIPISWGGIGTSNKALVDLLTPHLSIATEYAGTIHPEELILTMSLVWMMANYLIKMIFGVYFLRRTQIYTSNNGEN